MSEDQSLTEASEEQKDEKKKQERMQTWGPIVAGVICFAIVRYKIFEGEMPGFWWGSLSFAFGSLLFQVGYHFWRKERER